MSVAFEQYEVFLFIAFDVVAFVHDYVYLYVVQRSESVLMIVQLFAICLWCNVFALFETSDQISAIGNLVYS